MSPWSLTMMINVVGVWQLFALAMGATTFGTEMADGSLRFLLSRPVSRRRLWLVKMGVGCAALALLVALSTSVALVMAMIGLIASHEVGHFLGLFHTVEHGQLPRCSFFRV